MKARNTNHWVAAYPAGGHVPSLGEGESEATTEFYAIYLSFSLHIVKTVMDGDCGLDVMCRMLAWTTGKQNRDLLRNELGAFALKHMGNRAFVATMHAVGEIGTHLGLLELDSAGAALLADGSRNHCRSHTMVMVLRRQPFPKLLTPRCGTSAMSR